MAERKVPTPLKIRWQRFRERFGPLLMLALLVPITAWMWHRHTGVVGEVGEVQTVRVEIASEVDGRIINVLHRNIQRFDSVEVGEVVLRLDDRPVLAALAILRARIAVTQAELLAESIRWQHARSETHRDHEVARQRLMVEIEEQRLDVLDRRTEIEFQSIELARLDDRIAELERLVARGAETPFIVDQERLRRKALQRNIADQRVALRQAELNLAEAELRLSAIAEPLPDGLNELLEPIRAAIRVHDAEMGEIALRAEQLQIRAPIAGMITEVHARPGEVAIAGRPLLTIVSPETDSIVTFVRERHPMRPEVGAEVTVRPIHHHGQVVRSRITEVGAHVEVVPVHQRNDPNVPEWGMPVMIALPPELGVRPGELVRVQFH